MKINSIVIFTFIIFSFTSCKKEEECTELKNDEVIAVQGPANVFVGQTVSFIVQIELPDGCGEFDRFVTERSGNKTTIVTTSKHVGCNCSQGPKTVRVNYETWWDTPSTLSELVFVNNNGPAITHFIRITDPNVKQD